MLFSSQRCVLRRFVIAFRRAASLLKRWTLGTLRGSVSEVHLGAFLAEFTFGFNRRHSLDRGLLFYRMMTLNTAPPF